jgi:hypothetical protein
MERENSAAQIFSRVFFTLLLHPSILPSFFSDADDACGYQSAERTVNRLPQQQLLVNSAEASKMKKSPPKVGKKSPSLVHSRLQLSPISSIF